MLPSSSTFNVISAFKSNHVCLGRLICYKPRLLMSHDPVIFGGLILPPLLTLHSAIMLIVEAYTTQCE